MMGHQAVGPDAQAVLQQEHEVLLPVGVAEEHVLPPIAPMRHACLPGPRRREVVGSARHNHSRQPCHVLNIAGFARPSQAN